MKIQWYSFLVVQPMMLYVTEFKGPDVHSLIKELLCFKTILWLPFLICHKSDPQRSVLKGKRGEACFH